MRIGVYSCKYFSFAGGGGKENAPPLAAIAGTSRTPQVQDENRRAGI